MKIKPVIARIQLTDKPCNEYAVHVKETENVIEVTTQKYVKPESKPKDNRMKFGNYTFGEAIDGLMAYDLGCRDSGIKDDRLKQQLRDFLKENPKEGQTMLAHYARELISDDGLSAGYGLEDVENFIDWTKDELWV